MSDKQKIIDMREEIESARKDLENLAKELATERATADIPNERRPYRPIGPSEPNTNYSMPVVTLDAELCVASRADIDKLEAKLDKILNILGANTDK